MLEQAFIADYSLPAHVATYHGQHSLRSMDSCTAAATLSHLSARTASTAALCLVFFLSVEQAQHACRAAQPADFQQHLDVQTHQIWMCLQAKHPAGPNLIRILNPSKNQPYQPRPEPPRSLRIPESQLGRVDGIPAPSVCHQHGICQGTQ